MKEIRTRLAQKALNRGPKIVKKKCDHAHTLNSLETNLKSRDNEYKAI